MVDGLFGYNCLKTMIDYSVEWIRSRELIKVKGLLQDARQPPSLRSFDVTKFVWWEHLGQTLP